jgi:hypothetical protein
MIALTQKFVTAIYFTKYNLNIHFYKSISITKFPHSSMHAIGHAAIGFTEDADAKICALHISA